ncbi:khdc4, partial [Symbiodinium natans]
YEFAPHPEILTAFEFVPKLYGRKGVNMKTIADSCGGKVRLRGRGSRFLEKDGFEADMDLKLYLSCQTRENLLVGHRLVLDLLERIEADFQRFCRQGEAIALMSSYGLPPKLEGKSVLYLLSNSKGL